MSAIAMNQRSYQSFLALAGQFIITLLTLITVGSFLHLLTKDKPANPQKDTIPLTAVHELIAMVYWGKDSSQDLYAEIKREKELGERDRYFIPKSYVANANNSHFDDTNLTDAYQLEVYLLARQLMRTKYKDGPSDITKGKVVDVGCGSGFKLVKYLAPEFNTVGVETEPAISFLRKTYPQLTWIDSGKPGKTLKGMGDEKGLLKNCDVGICSDVIEHVREPDLLLAFLRKLSCEVYVVSTPMRENGGALEGPPENAHHVREWTFHEFQLYLRSQGFRLLHSYDGVQNPETQFHVLQIS